MSGVKTNIITAIKITRSNVNDSTQFEELLDTTTKVHDMKELSADMAYSSRKNLELVSKNGAIPYIPFTSHSTGKSRGYRIWRKMYLYFVEHYDEFMQHYHKRSNAESVFSMMKRKFGSHLRCKKEVAQDNEILCKALCHNICVLIQECFELNIDINLEEHLPEVETVKNHFCTQKA